MRQGNSFGTGLPTALEDAVGAAPLDVVDLQSAATDTPAGTSASNVSSAQPTVLVGTEAGTVSSTGSESTQSDPGGGETNGSPLAGATVEVNETTGSSGYVQYEAPTGSSNAGDTALDTGVNPVNLASGGLATNANVQVSGNAGINASTPAFLSSGHSSSDASPATQPVLAVFGDIGSGPVDSTGSGSGVNGAAAGAGGSTVVTYTTPGSGLVINVTYDASVANAPTGFTWAVADVVDFYESHFTNPVTVNIDVGFGEIDGQHLASDALGESEAYLTSVPYAQLRTALVNSLDVSGNQAAAASLPASSPVSGNYWVTTAEAKALGLAGAGASVDGYVGFGSEFPFAYDNSSGVPTNEYDFLGVVAHEFSEVMGRSMMDGEKFNGSAGYEPLDLFHYSAPGVRDFSGTTPGYASPDGGYTNLDNFNTNPAGDMGDWAASAGNDSYDAFSNPHVVNPVSPADFKVMNLLGWNSPSDNSTYEISANAVEGHDMLAKRDMVSPGSGVLAHDWDYNSSAVLSVSSVQGSSQDVGKGVAGEYGTLWLNANGSYQYLNTHPHAVALAGGTAEDTFNFTVSDGNGSTANSTLTILITSPKDHYVDGTQGGTLQGQINDEVLNGASGQMTVDAHRGNHQVLVGGSGDTLEGNENHDTFMFSPGLGEEKITNFKAEHDKIDLPASELPDYAALKSHLHQDGANTSISLGDGDSIILTHFNVHDLHSHNFHFML
jgi:VCBS repeat-containing protein